MASDQVVMRARYKNNGVKAPGIQGVLIMTEDKLDFSPDDPMPSAKLNVGFRSIEEKVLGKIKDKQSSAPDAIVDSEKSATTVHDEQLCPEEIKLRMKFLAENSEPQKLQKQFVIIGGVLSEAEFWATRKKLLAVDVSKMSKQRLGFKSAMHADVRPLTDGWTKSHSA